MHLKYENKKYVGVEYFTGIFPSRLRHFNFNPLYFILFFSNRKPTWSRNVGNILYRRTVLFISIARKGQNSILTYVFLLEGENRVCTEYFDVNFMFEFEIWTRLLFGKCIISELMRVFANETAFSARYQYCGLFTHYEALQQTNSVNFIFDIILIFIYLIIKWYNIL